MSWQGEAHQAIRRSPPIAHPVAPQTDTSRRNKYIVIGCWTGCVVWALLPSMLLNLYIFGGIDFPNETVSLIWLIVGPTLLYGTLIAAPIIALLGVRRRDIGYPPLVAVLAIPIIIQVVAVALYVVLTDIYGAVCC